MSMYHTESFWKECLDRAGRKEPNYYKSTDIEVYKALEAYSVKGKDVLVFGSVKPWYEALAIVYGCKSCTVSEYNVPESCISGEGSSSQYGSLKGESASP